MAAPRRGDGPSCRRLWHAIDCTCRNGDKALQQGVCVIACRAQYAAARDDDAICVTALRECGCVGKNDRAGAWGKNNRVLGQSSLLVFGATAGKVLLHDLSGSPPLARIISLVVLGLTFYVGGMLYQKLVATRDGT